MERKTKKLQMNPIKNETTNESLKLSDQYFQRVRLWLVLTGDKDLKRDDRKKFDF